MVGIFYLWLDLPKSLGLNFSGIGALVALAWIMTGLGIGIDIARFWSAKQRDAIRRLPLFGKWIRKHEEEGFNTATYFVLAAAMLITAFWLGFGQERFLVAAILVAGLADALAGTVRFNLAYQKRFDPKTFGLLAFGLIAFLLIWLVGGLGFIPALIIAWLSALAETFTPDLVRRFEPKLTLWQNRPRPKLLALAARLYPDDNLVVPIIVWVMACWLD
jgi:dolichol kinase